jgi:hypothetical protein
MEISMVVPQKSALFTHKKNEMMYVTYRIMDRNRDYHVKPNKSHSERKSHVFSHVAVYQLDLGDWSQKRWGNY